MQRIILDRAERMGGCKWKDNGKAGGALLVWEGPLITYVLAAMDACTAGTGSSISAWCNTQMSQQQPNKILLQWRSILCCTGVPAPGGLHAAPFGLVKLMTSSPWKMLTSSMPGMVLTPSRLSVFCSRLSSVLVVLCTAFFFL